MAGLIQAALADLLGADAAGGIGLDDPLISSGVNSTTAVALTSQLESSLGASLPPTLVFDYVTVKDLSAYLASTVAPAVAATPSPAPTAPAPTAVAAPPSAAAAGAGTAGVDAVQLVTQAVRQLIGGEAAVNPSAPLMSVGLNSTLAVALASSLEAAVGNPLPATLVSMDATSPPLSVGVCLLCSALASESRPDTL